MVRIFNLFFLSLILASSASAQSPSTAEDVLRYLRTQKSNYLNSVASDSSASESPNRTILSIYDRLIFGLASRYPGGPVADFLSEYALFTAEQEQEQKRPLVQFYAHLSEIIKMANSEREPLGPAIEAYIHSSPPESALSAARFLLLRSYSAGEYGSIASGSSRVDAGQMAELFSEPADERITDYEFSGEMENWFATQIKSTAAQTNEQNLEKTPEPTPTTLQLDSSAPADTPAVSTATSEPPAAHSQTTTASASEPTPEKVEKK